MENEIHGENVKDVVRNLFGLEEAGWEGVADCVCLTGGALSNVGCDVGRERGPPPVLFEEGDGDVASSVSDKRDVVEGRDEVGTEVSISRDSNDV